MGNRFQRRLDRKEKKGEFYADYAKRKLQEKKGARIMEAREQFVKEFNATVPAFVPDWQQRLALMFPPKWWYTMFRVIANWFFGVKHKEKMISLYNNKKRRSLSLLSRWWVSNIIRMLSVDWLLWVRKKIYHFGIYSKITWVENGEALNFKIFRFTRCIHETEIKV